MENNKAGWPSQQLDWGLTGAWLALLLPFPAIFIICPVSGKTIKCIGWIAQILQIDPLLEAYSTQQSDEWV